MAKAFSKATQGVSKFFGIDSTKKPRVEAQNRFDAAQAASAVAAEEQAAKVEADKASASSAAAESQEEAQLQARRNALSESLRKEGGSEGRRRFLTGAK